MEGKGHLEFHVIDGSAKYTEKFWKRAQSSACLARLKPAKRTPPNTSRNKSSNTQRTENKTTDVVIHQLSRKVLKMDILMPETC